MIVIHPRFRNESEALEAARETLSVAGGFDRDVINGATALRVAHATHELALKERINGYAGPYVAAPDIATCPCAVCVARRTL